MISFKNDYSELAHPNIFKLMNEYSNQQFNGYGLDSISEKAKDKIKKYFSDEVDIHFMIGGTSVNRTFISHVLKPYEAVISAETGHINVHETGAIESTGHKILLVKTLDGKLKPKDIEDVFNNHVDEHMVIPKLVYISNTTEIGTLYTKEELKALSAKCKELDLYLYLDGARLGVALTNDSNNLSLNDINSLTDAFYLNR
ncbi:MAG: aminotransferase class I/II-fold pyridoxal phosphate-dependent enzyme, partial [Bacilli bacterium]